MTTNFNIDATKRGQICGGTQFSDTVFSATLKAATEATVTVPLTAAMGAPTATSLNKFMAMIVCDESSDVFMSLNATAAVPVGNTFAATTSELVPANQYNGRMVKSGDVIHFISAGTPGVTISFYAIQE